MEEVVLSINNQLAHTGEEVSRLSQELATNIADIPPLLQQAVKSSLQSSTIDLEATRSQFFACKKVVVTSALDGDVDGLLDQRITELINFVSTAKEQLTSSLHQCRKALLVRRKESEEMIASKSLDSSDPKQELECIPIESIPVVDVRPIDLDLKFSVLNKNDGLVLSDRAQMIVKKNGTKSWQSVLADTPLTHGHVYRWKVRRDSFQSTKRRCVGIITERVFVCRTSLLSHPNAFLFCSTGNFNNGEYLGTEWGLGQVIEVTADLVNYQLRITESTNLFDFLISIDRNVDCYYPVFSLHGCPASLELVS
ncbi:hypothetical protein GEMRC1_001582 [Eukaryota sp. GEM-RC1]